MSRETLRRTCRRWRFERVGEGVGDRMTDYLFIIVAQELLQAVGIHDVLPSHVRDCLGRNRRDASLPQEFENRSHGPFSRHTLQFGVSHSDATGEGQGLSA